MAFPQCLRRVKTEARVRFQSGAHTRAMEVCIELNEWKTAIELARDHGQVADVSGLLAKYARQFIENNNILSAVELYR